MKKSHISFSELKIWSECPHRHKLDYIDQLRAFKGNEYTAFGKAIHAVGEKFVFGVDGDEVEEFEANFLYELKLLKKEDKEISFNDKLVQEMRPQGAKIAPQMIPALKEHFGPYEVISAEEQLYEPLAHPGVKFKGFIDLVIKVGQTYHILDWKSCTWGWDARKKSDRILSYQLTLYKHFYAAKHNIDPADIQTHFALLKRTSKSKPVEIFEIKCGTKKIDNALKLLNTFMYNTKKGNHIKNRLSCKYCPYMNTKHCT